MQHTKAPILIIITGMPATGKSTLGKALSAKYNLPYIPKDVFKECMFNTLGIGDKNWSRKIGTTSYRIMDYIITEELRTGRSLIVESNFSTKFDSERFNKFQEQYGCTIVQILCWAEGETVYQRFMARIGTEGRHEGHVEEISPEEIRQIFVAANGKDAPLDINGTTIELNTTNLSDIDYTKIYKAIDASLL